MAQWDEVTRRPHPECHYCHAKGLLTNFEWLNVNLWLGWVDLESRSGGPWAQFISTIAYLAILDTEVDV